MVEVVLSKCPCEKRKSYSREEKVKDWYYSIGSLCFSDGWFREIIAIHDNPFLTIRNF